MTTNLGRVQIVEGSPPALPGKCAMCGTTNGTFVDMGWDIEFYGVVYFCRYCIAQVCEVIGFISSERYEEMKVENKELLDKINKLKEENDEFRRALDAINRVFGGDDIRVISHVSRDEKSDEIDSDSSTGEERPTEQIDESGSKNLLNDVSFDDFFDPDSI